MTRRLHLAGTGRAETDNLRKVLVFAHHPLAAEVI